MDPIQARATLLALAVALSAAAGCETTRTVGYYKPIPPKPRPLEPAPADARADALVLNISTSPVDTNGNGYPDLIYATAHLFDTRYAPAIQEDGAFDFRLYAPGDAARPDAEPMRHWRFDAEATKRSAGRSAFGPCYRFGLSLLDGGSDVLPVPMADVVCRFEPAGGGEPTYAGEVATIQIGQRVLVPTYRWEEGE